MFQDQDQIIFILCCRMVLLVPSIVLYIHYHFIILVHYLNSIWLSGIVTHGTYLKSYFAQSSINEALIQMQLELSELNQNRVNGYELSCFSLEQK